jgi:hypothetical protein
MQVHPENQQLELPSGIRTKLEDFRRRVWAVKLAEGVLAAVFGLVLSYIFVFVLDRFWDTPAWLRAAILVAGTVGLAIVLPYTWHRWVWRTRRLEAVARVLRRRFHRLGDQLLGIVELVHSAPKHQQSEALCRAALKQVDEETRNVDFAGAVPNPRHRRWAWAAGIPLAIALAALIIIPAAGTNALARWLMPWRDTERYTFAQLDKLPDKLVVPYAESFPLTATLAPETAWSPASGRVQYGSQPSVKTSRQDDRYEFGLPPQKEADRLAVSIGDVRKSITVEPTTRPELTSMTANIKLPDYLQYSQDLSQDIRGGTISAVKGSEVTFTGTATRELADAEMDGEPQSTDGNRLVTYPVSIVDSSERSLVWKDELGLSAKQPFVLSITAQEDGLPTLTCSELAREQVVLDSEVLSFQVLAEDDFGVKQIGLEWSGIEDPLHNPHPTKGEKIISGGGPEKRSVDATATFSAKREGVPPQTLKVRLFAVDYLPDRERVYSPEYVLYVLSPEEHAIWLTQRLRKWMRQAQGVYEREVQLHLTNEELRSLSAEELDQPENRRRIETQAAAEQSNARQLSAVAGEGEALIKQAMRNDQFNVMTLEDWAGMLKILNDIAQNRMPSVADLLKSAASAKSSSSSSKPGQAQQPAPPSEQQKPQVGNNRDGKPGSGGKTEPGKTNNVPSIADVESSFNEPNESQSQEPTKQKPSKFGLPVTTVQGGGAKHPPQEGEKSPAQEDVDQAVEEQENLLEEFAKVAEELQLILDNLEGSTFVKRLKAASRRQLEVAGDLNETLVAAFGLDSGQVDEETRTELDKVCERETAEGENVYTIQDDMEAYFNRVHQTKFQTVLDEMRQMQVATRLADLGQIAKTNMSGQSIAHAEFWADTLDRWAEQLVGPGCPGQGQCKGGGASLPPAVVLEVLKILEAEIDLREETRGVEQARAALEILAYQEQARPLATTQGELAERVAAVMTTLRELPEGEAKYPQELALLTRVEEVMWEAEGILQEPNTGAEAIAAETEAIELLLAAKRCNPNGGGGGGATPGGGGGGDTDEAALALIGVGQELNANYQARNVSQATGTGGAALPAEYRAGLDAYFTALEESGHADAN